MAPWAFCVDDGNLVVRARGTGHGARSTGHVTSKGHRAALRDCSWLRLTPRVTQVCRGMTFSYCRADAPTAAMGLMEEIARHDLKSRGKEVFSKHATGLMSTCLAPPAPGWELTSDAARPAARAITF